MRALILTLSAMLVTLAATEASGAETCRVSNGYVSATGRGATKKEAREKARLTCGEMLLDVYAKRPGQITDEQVGYISDACVNLECE